MSYRVWSHADGAQWLPTVTRSLWLRRLRLIEVTPCLSSTGREVVGFAGCEGDLNRIRQIL